MKKRYITLGLVGAAALTTALSAKPAIYTIRNILFKIPIDTWPQTYSDGTVEVKTNVTYDSRYANNTYDTYTPQKVREGSPLIAWVHGGGFISVEIKLK